MTLKVSLKHYLFIGRGSTGKLPIFLRITYNRKKAEMHSGYTCTLKEWSEADQATKSNPTINRELSDQKNKVYDFLIERGKASQPISAAILKDLLTGKRSTQVTLLAYLDNYIKELEIKREIKPISLNKYRQSKSSLAAFIQSKYELPDVALDQISYEFIKDYGLYLKQVNDLHKNTINKYHTRLRTILIRALAEGIITKQPYANFKLVNQKTERTFLSKEYLNKLITVDLSHNQSLDKARDIFIFSCYTGLRFQDAQSLTLENLPDYKKKPFITMVQQKTERALQIPLMPPAKRIIDKYNSLPERKIFHQLLPKISNQKVNAYLKIIGDLSGLKTNLTHHVARHTFATTICLNNNMPLEDVSILLGHSSLKATQIYGKITQERLLTAMHKIISKI
jgi:integrase/recombinase XerD